MYTIMNRVYRKLVFLKSKETFLPYQMGGRRYRVGGYEGIWEGSFSTSMLSTWNALANRVVEAVLLTAQRCVEEHLNHLGLKALYQVLEDEIIIM